MCDIPCFHGVLSNQVNIKNICYHFRVDPENFGGKYDDVIDVTMGFWVSIWAGGTVSIVPSVNFVAADYIKVLKNVSMLCKLFVSFIE